MVSIGHAGNSLIPDFPIVSEDLRMKNEKAGRELPIDSLNGFIESAIAQIGAILGSDSALLIGLNFSSTVVINLTTNILRQKGNGRTGSIME